MTRAQESSHRDGGRQMGQEHFRGNVRERGAEGDADLRLTNGRCFFDHRGRIVSKSGGF